MNRISWIAKALFLGLLTTQILSTLHVYLSNADLYQTVTTISEAGYLSIPNQRVTHTLKEFAPAFFGGIFFTLSIGAGLSLFSVGFAWFYDRISGRSKTILIPIIILWIVLCLAANSQGFCPVVLSYFLIVPPVVFIAALKWMPEQRKKGLWLNRLLHILPVAVLMMLWTAHANQSPFQDIRDYLLLSNRVGEKINNFYYRYTMYPAEVFKSLEQKTLKPCRVAPITDKAFARRIDNTLIRYDYLPVNADAPVEIEIDEAAKNLVFKYKGDMVLQSTDKDFFSFPEKVLKNLAVEVDRHVFFRQATIFCLVLGFPVVLYVMVFALVRFVLSFLVGATPSSVAAATICFSIGLALLLPLSCAKTRMVDPSNLSEALNSESRQHRVAALKTIVRQRLEIWDLQACRRLPASPHISERLWLARAFGLSRHPETYQLLLTLLDDPCPNVVCKAFYALGQRGDRRAEKEIMKRIERSDHWYSQLYAYKALRQLGWRQEMATKYVQGNISGQELSEYRPSHK